MPGRPTPLLLLALSLSLLACRQGGEAAHGAQASKPLGSTAKPGRAAGQLASVKPPPEPCLGRAGAPPQLLARRAAQALEGGEDATALACSEEALRGAPGSRPALRLRAAALAGLGRSDEARMAWARALADDPDDPEALLGAAEFYLDEGDGEGGREGLELGLAYALRGAERTRRGPERDRRHDLARRLLTVAAAAANELGSPDEGLEHASAALLLDGKDLDARYEKGVALYELCRFGEARAELERVLAAEPDDAWALHELALVCERTGDPRRAERLEKRARALAPDAFPAPVEMDRAAFEAEVRRAVAALPEPDRRALQAVPVEVEEVPAVEDLTAVDPPLSPAILGLFRGPPEREACLPEDGPRCRSIVFYRRNLARFARDRGELAEQVRVTLLHELGHLRGESDEELRARGLE